MGTTAKTYTTSVTSKGQVTIPAEVRKSLGIRTRDRVRFVIEDGDVKIVRSSMSLEEAFSSIPPLGRKDTEAMVREAKEERAERLMDKMQSGDA
jgi:AbrB family looped-hinge helix DNA binding protein